uniref:TBC domain-containing protein kinase-like protein n=1 Tax=Steinernema glaseri TaxID=37863 RepID=A0A1I7ZAU9_9BILA
MHIDLIKFGAITLLGKDADEVSKTSFTSLPISPSTRMIGRFATLTALNHPGICKYVEMTRSQAAQNITIVISEDYGKSLASCMPLFMNEVDIFALVGEVVEALSFLHSKAIVVGYLTAENVLLREVDGSLHAGLSQYGLHYISDGGRDLDFPLANVYYTAPELWRANTVASGKSDVWSLGIILAELITGQLISQIWNEDEYLVVMRYLIKNSNCRSILQGLLEKLSAHTVVQNEHGNELFKIAESCLQVLPSNRMSCRQLLQMFFPQSQDKKYSFPDQLASIDQRNEMFYLWKLCGSSVETILINRGVIQLKSPLLSVPSCVVDDYSTLGCHNYNVCDLDLKVFALPISNMKKRLSDISPRLLHKSYEYESKDAVGSNSTPTPYILPTVVKEKDIDYQASRMRAIAHLIQSYPFKRSKLLEEVKLDVPPLYRGRIWATLLNVRKDSVDRFFGIDTISEQPSDRQLQVDIPRCHQYEELMTSPAAHRKLKSLLKAWLFKHPHYVYWQGLDSLTAPFLVLNFNDIPLAYACLNSFINRYLKDFFLKDNSAVIQEYLCVFNHLVSFLDAELFTHLRKMDFLPELFAIPWFLTCFAHVLPLYKLFHLWDTLLLVDSSFPLFIGVAILAQLRPQLIDSHFNDAILLFSDLPDLSIDQVVGDSLSFYNSVPQSCAYRQHATCHLDENHGQLIDYSVQELREFHCPRISPHDMLTLLKEGTILIIDVRSSVEYNRGSIQGSISFPYTDDISDSSFSIISFAVETAVANCHTICVLDNSHLDHARKLSAELVSRCYNRVCILDGGLQALSAELFTVSS